MRNGDSARAELNALLIEIYQAKQNSPAAKLDPIKFYMVGTVAKYAAFAPLALEMFTIAAGEATCERMFSAAGYVDSTTRLETAHARQNDDVQVLSKN